MIKLLALAVFAVAIFFAIYQKPKIPKEIRENMREVPLRTYGGPMADTAWNVLKDGDNFIIIGDTESFGSGGKDAYVVKTDSNGDVLWTRYFGGTGNDVFISGVVTEEGYVLCGGTSSMGEGETDGYVIAVDRDGEKLWENTYGGPNYDYFFAIEKSPDGGFICAGYTSSYSENKNSDGYIVKISKEGKTGWQKYISSESWSAFYDIKRTADGGYAALGYSDLAGSGRQDIYLYKLGADGREKWQKFYGAERDDRGYSLLAQKDGTLLILGISSSFQARGFGFDTLLIKTGPDGKEIWSRSFPAADMDAGSHIAAVEGGYFIGINKKCYGICDSNAYLVKTTTEGDIAAWRIFAGKSDDTVCSIVALEDGSVVMAGTTLSYGHGRGDMFLTKISPAMEQVW